MVSVLFSLMMSFQVQAEVLPGEELYLHCVSPQWQVDVMKTPGPERDTWRMEISQNIGRGWELLENVEPTIAPLYQDRIPSPTVFRTPGHSLIVPIQTLPPRGPQRQGRFHRANGEWIQNLMCKLPWMPQP